MTVRLKVYLCCIIDELLVETMEGMDKLTVLKGNIARAGGRLSGFACVC